MLGVLLVVSANLAPADTPAATSGHHPVPGPNPNPNPVPVPNPDPVPVPDPDPVPVPDPDPDPDPVPAPDPNSDMEAYCATRLAPDPNCWSSIFGNDLAAANGFLGGVETGPGGLKAMTADEQGLGISAPVGTTPSFVEPSLLVAFDQVIYDDGSCAVTVDDARRLGIATDADGRISAYLIGNPVVKTPGGLGVGSTLEELKQAYGLDVVKRKDGSMRAATAPVPAVGPLTGTEPRRSAVFEMDPKEVVIGWRVGAASVVERSHPCASP